MDSSSKDDRHLGSEPTRMTTFSLNPLLKGRMTKYSHILWSCRLGLPQMNTRDTAQPVNREHGHVHAAMGMEPQSKPPRKTNPKTGHLPEIRTSTAAGQLYSHPRYTPRLPPGVLSSPEEGKL